MAVLYISICKPNRREIFPLYFYLFRFLFWFQVTNADVKYCHVNRALQKNMPCEHTAMMDPTDFQWGVAEFAIVPLKKLKQEEMNTNCSVHSALHFMPLDHF